MGTAHDTLWRLRNVAWVSLYSSIGHVWVVHSSRFLWVVACFVVVIIIHKKSRWQTLNDLTHLSSQPSQSLPHSQVLTSTESSSTGPNVREQHLPFSPFRSCAGHQCTKASMTWAHAIDVTWFDCLYTGRVIIRCLCACSLYQFSKPRTSKCRRDSDAWKHVTRSKSL